MEKFSHVIIGAGVIGLSIASRLIKKGSTLVIEKNCRIGEEISSRNSEVIHAGLYYPRNHLKTSLCIEGKNMLYELCDRVNIPHKKCGKWIVSQNEKEDEVLYNLYTNTIDLNVPAYIYSRNVMFDEPNVRAKSVIFSPTSGIIDTHSYMMYLHSIVGDNNIVFKTLVTNIIRKNEYEIIVSDEKNEPFSILSDTVINCAGLHSEYIARKLLKNPPKTYYAKGQYFSYNTPIVKKLIYPIPPSNLTGLGIHATVDMSGRVKFGPDVEYIDEINYKNNEDKRDAFYNMIKTYLPTIQKENIIPDYTGIRPKLYRENEKARDFYIQQDLPNFINLMGIESPGITASLAIARYVENMLY